MTDLEKWSKYQVDGRDIYSLHQGKFTGRFPNCEEYTSYRFLLSVERESLYGNYVGRVFDNQNGKTEVRRGFETPKEAKKWCEEKVGEV